MSLKQTVIDILAKPDPEAHAELIALRKECKARELDMEKVNLIISNTARNFNKKV